jgi:hypothetical protein
MSGADPFTVRPREWTIVPFDGRKVFDFPVVGWSLVETILQIRYPLVGCPSTFRGRFVRHPGTAKDDETGHNDVNPIKGLTRHHHWEHFLKNSSGLRVAFRVWHDGSKPVVVDGRQFKFVGFASSDQGDG